MAIKTLPLILFFISNLASHLALAEAEGKTATEIRVATFNILGVALNHAKVCNWLCRKEDVFAQIENQNLDIIGLQEVMFSSKNQDKDKNGDQLRDIKNKFGESYHIVVSEVESIENSLRNVTLVRRDRFSIQHTESIKIPNHPEHKFERAIISTKIAGDGLDRPLYTKILKTLNHNA